MGWGRGTLFQWSRQELYRNTKGKPLPMGDLELFQLPNTRSSNTFRSVVNDLNSTSVVVNMYISQIYVVVPTVPPFN